MNQEFKGLYQCKNGFTFIELISILVIIGIMSAVAASRIMNNSSTSIAARDVIKSHIRYVQLMAMTMTSENAYGIDFRHDSYVIFKDSSPLTTITLPGKDSPNLPISPTLGTAVETIYFDPFGIPCTTSTLNTPRLTGAVGYLGITIIKDTGFIQ